LKLLEVAQTFEKSDFSVFFNNPPIASNKTSVYPLLKYILTWWPQVPGTWGCGISNILFSMSPVYSPKNPPEDPLTDAISQGPQGVNSRGLGNIQIFEYLR
jgi:hypothetical protein